MLNDLAIGIEPEDIDSGGFLTAPVQVTHMDKGKVAIDGDAFYLAGMRPAFLM